MKTEKNTEPQTQQNESNTPTVAKLLDNHVLSVIGQENLMGFELAYQKASAIQKLKELLSDEYMAPLMALQGTRLGFRTDKDRKPDGSKGEGYPMEVVRECLIEAVLMGLQPTGNEFNIIGGNTYATKEGCGSKLNKMKKTGLDYSINTGLPRMSSDQKSCAFDIEITWTVQGETTKEMVPIPIRVNSYMGVDAMVGKATRKARAWLISRVTGMEFTDGDAEDAGPANVLSTKVNDKVHIDKEYERTVLVKIAKCKTLDEVDMLSMEHPDIERKKFDDRIAEI